MSIIFSLFLKILEIFIRGLLIKKLWMWFIVSHFGLIPLNIGTAIGISLIASSITVWKHYSPAEFAEARDLSIADNVRNSLLNSLLQGVSMLFVFIAAWLIHIMM